MTPQEIKDYQNNIGKGWIRLFGYTSTSLTQSNAESFMWEDEDTGHQKVLFHFLWDLEFYNYFLDGGAYDHENEVLLVDGCEVQVMSVEDFKNEKGKKLYTLITLRS